MFRRSIDAKSLLVSDKNWNAHDDMFYQCLILLAVFLIWNSCAYFRAQMNWQNLLPLSFSVFPHRKKTKAPRQLRSRGNLTAIKTVLDKTVDWHHRLQLQHIFAAAEKRGFKWS